MAYATVAELREYLEQVPGSALQRVELTGSPTGGTFTLSYEGQTTAAIARGALASAVQAALVALSTIGAGNAEVRGPAGGPWIVALRAGNDASPLTGDGAALTGGSGAAVSAAPANDALLGRVLDRASAIVDQIVGFSFGEAASGVRTFYGDGTDYLQLAPYVAGTLATVAGPTGLSLPTYAEIDGMLVATTVEGVLVDRRPGGILGGARAVAPTWRNGAPYQVTADWGYDGVPADIVEACLEIAVRIWRGRDAGFSNVIGVEGGGAVGYEKALPPLVKEILLGYRRRLSLGVY
jgi:hypothetical protein